ncbi:MAG: response regulator with CheY-like receiver domain and winged-helix DNA-binding domain [Fusobacteria bacterium]|nr:MAG: response regulator with CheY-like receiver domain and winged-helix DNA-binding domain [Fusobacteriota bacterium]KAF0230107.1 MAG: response regulator with CheY-like receiver domain and winged-helix DNA-binding [Fusobacteriota bacterium]
MGLKKVLVVDDEANIVDVIKSYLENSGYEVLVAYNGAKAIQIFEKESPSLIILDLMLPDINGQDVCKTIRKRSNIPILMLTAKVEEDDLLKGLDIGADDYMTKPFSPRELVARVAALLRRVKGERTPLSGIMHFNDGQIVIDTLKQEVKKLDKVVNLTPIEYKILLTLAKYPLKVFTREELISNVFGNDFNGYDRTVDTHIKNLRKKIEIDNKKPIFILTVHGTGYRFGGE